jgi:tripartite-type tricarboxylate transporter receptor subunit TctC
MLRAIAGVALLCASLQALAQAWPSKPVRWVISQPPGTGPDILARVLGDTVSKTWGQPVVVDNRPGGASIIGIQAAQKSPPDGHNFLFTTGGILLNVYTFKSLPYDVDRDFIPVTLIGRAPFLLVVNNSMPASTTGELIALLKAQPDKFSYASDGPKGLSGLMGEMLRAVTGTKYVHVPYNGTNPQIADTIAGRTHFLFSSTPPLMAHIRSGKLKPIGVTGPRRVPGLESVPLLTDTLPDFTYMGWYMIYAPTGTANDVVQRVNADMGKVLADPKVAQRLLELGTVVAEPSTSDSLRAFHRAEHDSWRKLVQTTGIQPD